MKPCLIILLINTVTTLSMSRSYYIPRLIPYLSTYVKPYLQNANLIRPLTQKGVGPLCVLWLVSWWTPEVRLPGQQYMGPITPPNHSHGGQLVMDNNGKVHVIRYETIRCLGWLTIWIYAILYQFIVHHKFYQLLLNWLFGHYWALKTCQVVNCHISGERYSTV